MVAALRAVDVSVGCMGMVGQVKSAALTDGAARVGRRCGPPWAIPGTAVMQPSFRHQPDGGAGKVP